jgi:hypothetical protein
MSARQLKMSLWLLVAILVIACFMIKAYYLGLLGNAFSK